MKKIQKPKKLVLLSILAGLIYLFMMGSSLLSEWDDFQLGYWEGFDGASVVDSEDPLKCSLSEVFFFYVLPKKGVESFPDKISNLKNNSAINIRHSEFKASVPKKTITKGTTFFYYFFSGLTPFLMMIICLIIPIQFYKVINSITKEVIFEKENIRRIRLIGISLILFYFLYFFYNFLNFKRNSQLFEFSDYTLKMDSVDAIWLMLGIVVLLIAEIISRGKALKEEQELTI